jgi:hypothetical protein
LAPTPPAAIAGDDVAIESTNSVEARSAQRRKPRRKFIAILQKMLS